jgi:hypothetical protein
LFDSLLLRNGELYIDSASKTGFSSAPVSTSKSNFQLTGKTKTILNYGCKEYFSTDSACRIWVTEDLPSSINPGVRLVTIKGAVLGFELRQQESLLKSYAIKIE